MRQGECLTIDIKITKHVNDVIQKYASGLFRNVTLEFYGIKTAPIKELINPELPVVEVSGGAADVVFLLEDDTYLHFAFETGHNSAGAMLKCASYDIRLYERDGRRIYSVIIYTANVKTKPEELILGTLAYNPDVILMSEYDGNSMFAELETKINTGQELSDIDMLNLVLLPLMKHTLPRRELAENTIKLAQSIPDAGKRNACIAAAFAFGKAYLDEADTDKLLEVLKMTDLLVKVMKDGMTEKAIEIAKTMLNDGMGISTVAKYTGLDEAKGRELYTELKSAA